MSGGILGWLDDPPPGPALVDADSGEQVPWTGLADRVRRVADALAAPRKTLVACLAGPDVDAVAGYLGALAAGHAVLMVDGANSTQAAVAVAHYRPGFLVGGRTPRALPGGDAPVHDDLAVLLSTSGSTGGAKTVRLSRGNVEANAAQIVGSLGIDDGQRAVQSLPLHYSYGLSVLNSHLAARATVVLTRESIAKARFWTIVREHAVTAFAGVPFAYSILARTGFAGLDLPSLRTLTQAGGRLDPDLARRFAGLMDERGGRFFVMYGATEATARMSVLPPDRVHDKAHTVGHAVAGGSLTADADGELVYRGPNVMMGYAAGAADLARGDELGGRLRTGDLGAIDDDGFVVITGRRRRIAKLAGLRINLDELESALGSTPGSTPGPELAAVERDEKLVVLRESDPRQPDARDFSRTVGALVGLPSRFVRIHDVEHIPRTGSGKVDYSVLMDGLPNHD